MDDGDAVDGVADSGGDVEGRFCVCSGEGTLVWGCSVGSAMLAGWESRRSRLFLVLLAGFEKVVMGLLRMDERYRRSVGVVDRRKERMKNEKDRRYVLLPTMSANLTRKEAQSTASRFGQ